MARRSASATTEQLTLAELEALPRETRTGGRVFNRTGGSPAETVHRQRVRAILAGDGSVPGLYNGSLANSRIRVYPDVGRESFHPDRHHNRHRPLLAYP
jgi:hypothetical protein